MLKQLMQNVFDKSLLAADPYRAVMAEKEHILAIFGGKKLEKINLVSFGIAAVPMARAITDALGDRVTKGIIITKYGHSSAKKFPENVWVYEAGHPLPDENGLEATQKILALLREADSSTLVVFLISGGGSSLLTCPYEGISLRDKQVATELLMKAGANIHELNTVRKHISAVKGGRLAQITYPAKIVSLILSDVIDDSLDVIASGPTSPDSSTYEQAMNIIDKYNLKAGMPSRISDHIIKGVKGYMPETLKDGEPTLRGVRNIIVGNNTLMINAAKKAAEEAGFKTTILATNLRGQTSEIARQLASKVREYKKGMLVGENICLICGGEIVAAGRGEGKGGRNTGLALAFALEIQGESGVTFLSAATDGQDGATDAAGAFADGQMIQQAVRAGLLPEEYQKRGDSYSFFKNNDSLLVTGPTRTSVRDMQIIFIEKKHESARETFKVYGEIMGY